MGRWDEATPRASITGATPTPSGRKRSRWDESPAVGIAQAQFGATPLVAGITPGATPVGQHLAMATPGPAAMPMLTPGKRKRSAKIDDYGFFIK